jgi:hypothetical protein
MPILVHFGPVLVSAWYITGTGIKWCPYWYWHFCTFVQYQYGYGTLPVLALNGVRVLVPTYICWYQNTQIPITGNGYVSTCIDISTRTGIFLDPLPELYYTTGY